MLAFLGICFACWVLTGGLEEWFELLDQRRRRKESKRLTDEYNKKYPNGRILTEKEQEREQWEFEEKMEEWENEDDIND